MQALSSAASPVVAPLHGAPSVADIAAVAVYIAEVDAALALAAARVGEPRLAARALQAAFSSLMRQDASDALSASLRRLVGGECRSMQTVLKCAKRRVRCLAYLAQCDTERVFPQLVLARVRGDASVVAPAGVCASWVQRLHDAFGGAGTPSRRATGSTVPLVSATEAAHDDAGVPLEGAGMPLEGAGVPLTGAAVVAPSACERTGAPCRGSRKRERGEAPDTLPARTPAAWAALNGGITERQALASLGVCL